MSVTQSVSESINIPLTYSQYQRRDTLVESRHHWFFTFYRQILIQIPVKAFITLPFVIWWIFWVGDLMKVVNAHWDDLLLAGSFLSYCWLSFGAIFDWQLALDMWSYFSIFWAIMIWIGAVELMILEEYLFGMVVGLLGLLALLDGLFSVTFKFPHILKFTEKEIEDAKKRESVVVEVKPQKVIGIPFILIPLDGGKRVPLSEFPNMSTPTTFRDAYQNDDD